MFLINSQLDNVNTTLRLHHYATDISLNDSLTKQWTTMGLFIHS